MMGTNVSYERKTLVIGGPGAGLCRNPLYQILNLVPLKTSTICVLTTMALAQYFAVIMSATWWAHSYITCD